MFLVRCVATTVTGRLLHNRGDEVSTKTFKFTKSSLKEKAGLEAKRQVILDALFIYWDSLLRS